MRRLESTASLNAHLAAWPGVRQVCGRERRRTVEGLEHFAEHRDQAPRLILTGRTE